MTAKQIAEKYVYGHHDAFTDSQEIKDMIKDIDDYCKETQNRNKTLLGKAVYEFIDWFNKNENELFNNGYDVKNCVNAWEDYLINKQ